MASFGKPISRQTADRLVAGLLERARHYNADAGRPLFIAQLRIFGSYLRPEIDPLADVDVELSYGSRITDPAAVRQYTKARGQTALSFIDQLFWPQKELVQYLRNRSNSVEHHPSQTPARCCTRLKLTPTPYRHPQTGTR